MLNKYSISVIVISIFLIGFSVSKNDNPYVVILGVAQDGGAPHAACTKDCCTDKWNNPQSHNMVSSVGIVDPSTDEVWMIDATPDFSSQLNNLTMAQKRLFKGVFLTHAHIGHYTGLIHLGREVMGAKQVPVYAMPKMKTKAGAKKRFKLTGSGKLKRKHAFKSHILTKKETKQKHNLTKTGYVSKADTKSVKLQLGI